MRQSIGRITLQTSMNAYEVIIRQKSVFCGVARIDKRQSR